MRVHASAAALTRMTWCLRHAALLALLHAARGPAHFALLDTLLAAQQSSPQRAELWLTSTRDPWESIRPLPGVVYGRGRVSRTLLRHALELLSPSGPASGQVGSAVMMCDLTKGRGTARLTVHALGPSPALHCKATFASSSCWKSCYCAAVCVLITWHLRS
jgi:hypothetical protein